MYSLMNSDVRDIAIKVLSTRGLWGAIIATISIITLGYDLLKLKSLKQNGRLLPITFFWKCQFLFFVYNRLW